jgi:hypothetical protein
MVKKIYDNKYYAQKTKEYRDRNVDKIKKKVEAFAYIEYNGKILAFKRRDLPSLKRRNLDKMENVVYIDGV